MRSPLVSFLLGKGDRSISLAPQVISYFGAYTRLMRACSRNGAVDGTRTRKGLLGGQVSYHWTTTAYLVPAVGIEPPTQHLTLRTRLTVAVRPAALYFPKVYVGLSLL